MTPPPVCAHCPNPAVATVRGGGDVLTIRRGRTTNPRTAKAWAPLLHCRTCLDAAIDTHLLGLDQQATTGGVP